MKRKKFGFLTDNIYTLHLSITMDGLAHRYTRNNKLLKTPTIRPISTPLYRDTNNVRIRIKRSFSATACKKIFINYCDSTSRVVRNTYTTNM